MEPVDEDARSNLTMHTCTGRDWGTRRSRAASSEGSVYAGGKGMQGNDTWAADGPSPRRRRAGGRTRSWMGSLWMGHDDGRSADSHGTWDGNAWHGRSYQRGEAAPFAAWSLRGGVGSALSKEQPGIAGERPHPWRWIDSASERPRLGLASASQDMFRLPSAPLRRAAACCPRASDVGAVG